MYDLTFKRVVEDGKKIQHIHILTFKPLTMDEMAVINRNHDAEKALYHVDFINYDEVDTLLGHYKAYLKHFYEHSNNYIIVFEITSEKHNRLEDAPE